MHTKEWHVDVFLSEEGDVTKARAVLTSDSATHVTGVGVAHRSPRDPSVPEVGDEVAAGRALAALAQELLAVASHDIDALVPEASRLD